MTEPAPPDKEQQLQALVDEMVPADPADVKMTLAQYLALKQRAARMRKVPRHLTDRAAKHAKRDADRRGKPITWQEARLRGHVWNELCGRA